MGKQKKHSKHSPRNRGGKPLIEFSDLTPSFPIQLDADSKPNNEKLVGLLRPRRYYPSHVLAIEGDGTVKKVILIWQKDMHPRFPGAVVSHYGKGVFFPSRPQLQPSKLANREYCSPRESYPAPGEIETCLAEIIVPDKQRPVFIAYPLKDNVSRIAPGIKYPVAINWRPNPQEESGVIARLPFIALSPDSSKNSSIVIFPAIEDIIDQSPQVEQTIPWEPGDLVPYRWRRCFLKYCFNRQGRVFAFAFKAKA